ncbi:MAG: hypothetical protein ABIJ56_16500, partial [Pseudomonadota bacterium]
MARRRKPFRPFLDMSYLGVPDASLNLGREDLEELMTGRGSARLFLGYYTEEKIREGFARFSVQTKLNEMGLGSFRIQLDSSDPDRQVMIVRPVSDPGGKKLPEDTEPIAECILREAVLSPSDSIEARIDPRAYLVIQWIQLQNPFASFDPKTLLPGQSFPGLGVGDKVLQMFDALIGRLHLEGIITRPEFLHNAILYARAFKFLRPEAEGRLRALMEQLSHLNLWQIAWAAEKGFIVEDGEKRRFSWYQSEQIWANCSHLADYFAGDRYLGLVGEAKQ